MRKHAKTVAKGGFVTVKYVAIFLLKVYKATFSRWKGKKTCVYTPSCSVYSMEAYRSFGFFQGKLADFFASFALRPVGKGWFRPCANKPQGKDEVVCLMDLWE